MTALSVVHLAIIKELDTVVVVVLTLLTHRYEAVRGHRTGSNNSGAEDYLRRKTHKTEDNTHKITETDRIPQTEKKKVRSAYVRIKIHLFYMLNES